MREGRTEERRQDPGVPEALPRALAQLRVRVGIEDMDRLWIFPPLRRGRRERGLVAVSLYLDGEERRRVVTVSYAAERTGRELRVDPAYTDEGEAPPEFLPRVMEGVVRRSGAQLGEPREVEIDRKVGRFDALLEELAPPAEEVSPL